MIAVFATGCFEPGEDDVGDVIVDMTPPCTDGDTQSCALGEGCGTGTQECADGVYGECMAPAESCDGVDNDCDGTIDEDFPTLGDECQDGEGKCIDVGAIICDGAGGTICSARAGDGSEEICDGVDNDCDGTVDDDIPVVDCDTGLPGVCSLGSSTCEGGDAGCEPTTQPSDEVCDGLDNDCDGNVDEAEAGGPLVEPCYEGPEGTDALGQCAAGVTVCTDGMWGACADQVLPGEEICDGVDNDCDGEIDDTGTECVCNVGDTQECYTGTEGTAGIGACTAGAQTCLADGSGFGPCEGEVVDGVELCDGIDNDCDGEVDDAAGVGGPCSVGVGSCSADGFLACNLESGQVECDAEAGLPADEVCDGADNDCDGMDDNVAGAGEPCEVGEGACLARGVQVCGEGGLECGATPGQPAEETCDGVDNDCNGIVDDAAGVGEACEVGIGACISTGVNVCSGEGVVCGATPQEPAPGEYCGNGIDDDCDGDTDEPDCGIRCTDETVEEDCGPGGVCIDGLCGAQVCIDPPVIDMFGTYEGDTTDAPSQVTASCAAGAGSPENAYELRLGIDGVVCVDTFGSGYDTALYARAECDVDDSEIDCNDDTSGLQSQLELELSADGTYFVFVDGFSDRSSGPYQLTVREGPCSSCTEDRHCVGGQRCAPQGDGLGICVPLGCGDGVRNGGEDCDDGGNDSGDGCSADCQIEDGFDCVGADIDPIEVTVDGLDNCIDPIPLDVPAWPAYRSFYVSGAVNHTGDLYNANVGVRVDGVIHRLLSSERATVNSVEEAEAVYPGVTSDLFGVPARAVVEGGFFDGVCDDNQGVATAELRAVDFCFPLDCQSNDDCIEGTICVGGRCGLPVDSDGDGVSDDRDLDDDNDGIPDLTECFAGVEGQIQLINGSLEEPALGGAFQIVPQATVPGWSTTAGDGQIELWTDGFLGRSSRVGRQFAELNANQQGALYQDIDTVPGTTFDIRFYHRARGDGPENMALRIGPPGATVEILTAASFGADWSEYIANYTVPDGQLLTRFEFASLDPGAVGNLLDGVEFVPRCDDGADADGDGIPNSLDLDSDGDGILDADEAGHGLPNTDGRVDGDVGANGLVDAAETAPDSGAINYEVADVDGNGTFDFLELGPYPCGNGEIGEGEQCDDGNRDNGDGCSDECQVEPMWECVFNDEASVGPCAPGEAVETVTVEPGQNLPVIGGNGGNPFDDPCPPGEVVIGFDVAVGPWGGFGGQDFITQSQAQCATFDVVDGAVALAPTGLTPVRGNTNNPGASIRCPENHVVTGYVGYDAGGDQRYVAGLGLVCSPVAVVDGRVIVGEPVLVDPVGNTANEVGRFDCEAGQLVGGNVGRSGDIVDQFTMRCDTIVEACRQPAGSVCEFQGECMVDGDCAEGQLCRDFVCVQTGACPDDESFGEPNDDPGSATPVMPGRYEDLAVCGDEDWYTTELCPGGTLTIDLYFIDDLGDIDLAVQDGPTSTSVTDDERVQVVNDGAEAVTVTWRAYGFGGAQNTYAMDVTQTGCVEACPDGRFPAACPEGYVATDARTCEALEQEPAVQNGAFLDVCRAPTDGAYGINGVMLPGGGNIQNDPFFGNGSNGSRLNTAGVWACGPDGQNAAQAPINEAIGFATCFQLDAPGEYVIGLGGDDNLVATLDGAEIFRRNGAFREWSLIPVYLSGGTHIITLEGVNTGGPGGFGAEIYGPYAPGATADDAALSALDYANNIVFTSLDQLGTQFNTGTNSGFSCPDGLALDLCGDEPQCTRFDRLDRCDLLPTLCEGDGDCADGDVCVGGVCEAPIDTDGDGITDNRDIDDDGDGIPDVLECFTGIDGQVELINGSLEEPAAPAGRNLIANQADVPGWSTTAADGAMELWSNGLGGVPSAVGNQFAELNANVQGALYQDIDTVPGTTFDIRFYHRARGVGPENMELRIGPPGATERILAAASLGDRWYEYLATYTVPDGQVLTRFEFASLDPGSVGNFLDGVEFVPRCADENADTDGDGIPNSLDLDSDNDGLLDAEEAGHDLPHTNGVVNGPVGDNGLVDAAETLPDSNSINYEIRDADESGVPDFLEAVFEICDNGVDDDGDGAADCLDRDCNLDPACAVTRTVYFSAPATVAPNDVPGSPTRLYTVDGEGAVQLLGDILLDGAPIPVAALALSPDGSLWGFEYLPGDPVQSRLLLINPDTATAMVMGDPVDGWVNGAGFHPDGSLWVTDRDARQVRGYDPEVGLGPAVLDFPVDFLGSDITFDSAGNCYLTGVDVPFNQFPLYSCDLAAGTAEALPAIVDGPGFDGDGHTTIPAIAFAYDSVTCEERLYAFDSFSIDELGYIDLTGGGPVMTHIGSTGINFAYYQTPDLAGFPSIANAPDCEGRVGACQADADCPDGQSCAGGACVETPASCADVPVVGFGTYEGTTVGAPSTIDVASCAFGAPDRATGPEVIYNFRPDAAGTVCLNTNGSAYDTMLYVRSSCADAGSEVACDDDSGNGLLSLVQMDVEAEVDYFVYVDGWNGGAGDYQLHIFAGPCVEICDDGFSNDGDGAIDCDDADCEGDPACDLGCVIDDDCAVGQICSDAVCIESLDFDNDGIPDLRDLDDDNDGILDTIECTPGLAPVINSSFEAPLLADGAFLYVEPADQGGAFGWLAGIDGEPVEIQARGHATAAEAALGRQYAEANAAIPSGFYQDVQTEPGTRYEWTMYHRGRNGLDTLELRFGAPGPVDGLTPITQVTSNNDAWTLISGTYDVPAGQNVTRLSFATIAAAGGDAAGNFIDGFTFTPTCTLDTDGDGLINSRDLDSDGDGILDADEAGHGQPHTNGVVDGEVGGNGVPDVVETVPDSSDLNYEVAGGVMDFVPAANSVDDWTGDGRQGVDGWWYGYSDRSADVNAGHAPSDFVAFPVDGTDVRSETNFWDGVAYRFTPGPPPWTNMGQLTVHPNGTNNTPQWAIRRWVAPMSGSVRVTWTMRKTNLVQSGVTGRVWSGGVEYDMATIAGDDGVGVERVVEFDVVAGQAIDLAYDSLGTDGDRADFSDGGENSMAIELAPFGYDFLTVPAGDGSEVCDNGIDDDDDGLIDCGDADCRDDAACAIERIVYFSMPSFPAGQNQIPAPPSRLYALDSAGRSVLLGEMTLNGQPTAVTAIALHPDGELFGFAYDPASGTSTPMTIDVATGNGVAVAPPAPAHIHGAGFAPDGTLYVLDRTNQQVRVMDGAVLGAAVIDYPVQLDGGDIAFDADGNCFITGTAIGGETQRDIYSCDIEAGTMVSLGTPQPQGFEDGGGRVLLSSLAFALNDQTCETELYTLDGYLIDELGRVDVTADPPVVEQIASTGINYAYFIQPDAAGFPSVANSPGCAGAARQVPVMVSGFDMDPRVARIRTGDSVLWTNMDGARHTITSGDPGDGDAGSVFDGEVLAGGGTFEFTFDVPGDYSYFCRPHAGVMFGYRVVVSDDPALTACEESCGDLAACGLAAPDCVAGCMDSPQSQAAGACVADALDPAAGCGVLDAATAVNACNAP